MYFTEHTNCSVSCFSSSVSYCSVYNTDRRLSTIYTDWYQSRKALISDSVVFPFLCTLITGHTPPQYLGFCSLSSCLWRRQLPAALSQGSITGDITINGRQYWLTGRCSCQILLSSSSSSSCNSSSCSSSSSNSRSSYSSNSSSSYSSSSCSSCNSISSSQQQQQKPVPVIPDNAYNTALESEN